MPDTRPGIFFNSDGVCSACVHHRQRTRVDWGQRADKLRRYVSKYKGSGGYDCIIPVSGGKDSYFQTYYMKEILGLNPLLVCVSDPFTKTRVGVYNLSNLSSVFEADLYTFSLNPSLARRMITVALSELGSPTWCVDMAIYSIPLRVASGFGIPLVVYGENISWTYGGPDMVDTFSAKDQIRNDVVKPVDTSWWMKHGVSPGEYSGIMYPSVSVLDSLDPIYLSYFVPWDGRANYELAKEWGFRDLLHEWNREGYVDWYDSIDSKGYLVHPWFKYPKFGHARVTDVCSYWIRNGYMTRKEAAPLVREHDGKLDRVALDDFLGFLGMSHHTFWEVANKFYNPSIFGRKDGKWYIKNPVK